MKTLIEQEKVKISERLHMAGSGVEREKREVSGSQIWRHTWQNDCNKVRWHVQMQMQESEGRQWVKCWRVGRQMFPHSVFQVVRWAGRSGRPFCDWIYSWCCCLLVLKEVRELRLGCRWTLRTQDQRSPQRWRHSSDDLLPFSHHNDGTRNRCEKHPEPKLRPEAELLHMSNQ